MIKSLPKWLSFVNPWFTCLAVDAVSFGGCLCCGSLFSLVLTAVLSITTRYICVIRASCCYLGMVGRLSFVYCFLKYIKIKKETIATIKLPWLFFFSLLKYWSHGLSKTLPVLNQITRVSLC